MMGYRSDVACSIYGSPDMVDSFIAQDKLKGEKGVFDGYFKQDYVIRDKGGMRIVEFNMQHVKWYDSFEDVQTFEQMLNLIDSIAEDEGWIAAEFSRLGEEVEDIETRVYGHEVQWCLNIWRSFDVSI